jgi:phytoene dehydrogenase-like protein
MGAVGLGSAVTLGARRFAGVRARALLAGLSAHSALPLDRRPSAGIGLALGVLGHAAGWPLARGGSQRIADALVAELGALGGVVETGRPVARLDDLPPAGILMLDVTPRQLLAIGGARLPPGYRRRLARYRYGPGAFKVDWALDGPVPWRAPECARAATVHIGGTAAEIAAAEAAAAAGRVPERPFVLLVQPTLFDPTRTPGGGHTVWAYCHLPHASQADMTARIEAQIERFAPGFGDRVIVRRPAGPARLEHDNPNHVGGDIAGGVMDLPQLLARPALRPVPWATPLDGVFLCSSATPPGPGAHGMCGFLAAQAALRASRRGARRQRTARVCTS